MEPESIVCMFAADSWTFMSVLQQMESPRSDIVAEDDRSHFSMAVPAGQTRSVGPLIPTD